MKQKLIFSFTERFFLALLITFFLSCGNKKEDGPDEAQGYDSISVDTTGYIKTEVDNTDTDSIYEGY